MTPRIPADVQVLLDWWLPRIREALGLRLRSVRLFGGVAQGGYAPGRSDVDVCSVVDGGVQPEDGQRIAHIYDQMRETFVLQPTAAAGYRYVIEGQYIPVPLVTDSQAAGDCYVTWGRIREWVHGNPITPFDRYSLAHFGVLVWGENLHFAPPTREQLAQQLYGDLKSLTNPPAESLQRPRWLAMMITWCARSMVFWRDGMFLPKTDALQREIAAGGQFADAYRLALEVRQGGPAIAEQHTAALRLHFDALAQPAADLLRKLAQAPAAA